MVKISEISDDGSNDKKSQEEEENQNHNPPIRQELPEDLIISIFARIPRDRYPNLYLTSKAFARIITSQRVFKTRLDLGRTEHFLYTFIGFPPFFLPRWFILHRRNNNSLRLSMINSLPPLIPGSAVVTLGHHIYIFGGCLAPYPPTNAVIVIDCRFHTWRRLRSMRRARSHAGAGVIDGKIYVIGGCIKRGGDWVEVFDVKNENWGTMPGQNPEAASVAGIFAASVVMENKIYILDRMFCLVYEPRRCRWESWGLGNQQRMYWYSSSCVVDDMLYAIDHPRCFIDEYPIIVFDPRDVEWRPVKGVDKSDLVNLAYRECRMANLGGKLVILGRYQSIYCWDYNQDRDIWCIVIALERRGNGEIWGNVESTSRVLSCFMYPWIEHSRTVTV